jgi:hypothetical protein
VREKKKRKFKLKRNPIARILRHLLFKPKVVQSKKLYNRKRLKQHD